METQLQEGSEAWREEVRACLQRVLASPAFAASERLTSFLKYVVEETLEGRAERLKGYAIALSVFQCGDQFDPQTNSVVRVEATRLRKKLEEYYAGPGAIDPFEIRINRGTYVPTFIPKVHHRGDAQEAAQPKDEPPAPLVETVANRWPTWLGVGAALVFVIPTILLLAGPSMKNWRSPLPEATRNPTSLAETTPSVTVSRILNSAGGLVPEQDIQVLAMDLSAALANFDDIRVIDQTRRSGADGEYALTASINKSEQTYEILMRLKRTADQEVIWSRIYRANAPSLDSPTRARLISGTVSAIARTGGVIMADRYRTMPPLSDKTHGFACIVHASRQHNSPSAEQHQAVMACLDRTLADDPKYARAHAAQSLLLLEGLIRNYAHIDTASALSHASVAASEAVSLAPQSAHSHLAQFLTRFHESRFHDADESAARALALNPYSIEIKARIASAYVLRGDMGKADTLLAEVAAAADHLPAWLEAYSFLSAWAQGDLQRARRHGMRTTIGRTPLGIISKILMARMDQDPKALRHWTNRLETAFPRFAQNIPAALDRMAMAPALKIRLLGELNAVGTGLN